MRNMLKQKHLNINTENFLKRVEKRGDWSNIGSIDIRFKPHDVGIKDELGKVIGALETLPRNLQSEVTLDFVTLYREFRRNIIGYSKGDYHKELGQAEKAKILGFNTVLEILASDACKGKKLILNFIGVITTTEVTKLAEAVKSGGFKADVTFLCYAPCCNRTHAPNEVSFESMKTLEEAIKYAEENSLLSSALEIKGLDIDAEPEEKLVGQKGKSSSSFWSQSQPKVDKPAEQPVMSVPQNLP